MSVSQDLFRSVLTSIRGGGVLGFQSLLLKSSHSQWIFLTGLMCTNVSGDDPVTICLFGTSQKHETFSPSGIVQLQNFNSLLSRHSVCLAFRVYRLCTVATCLNLVLISDDMHKQHTTLARYGRHVDCMATSPPPFTYQSTGILLSCEFTPRLPLHSSCQTKLEPRSCLCF